MNEKDKIELIKCLLILIGSAIAVLSAGLARNGF